MKYSENENDAERESIISHLHAYVSVLECNSRVSTQLVASMLTNISSSQAHFIKIIYQVHHLFGNLEYFEKAMSASFICSSSMEHIGL